MISLAVKYRPKEFNEVSGQSYTIKILENQIKTNTIKHGYLFCGASGCGKTTIARIFAYKINNGKGSPIELDAASNGNIENIRQLITEAGFKSLDSEYKVYIIDEVHSVSPAAFQVFLKTLEEPPEKTIFILCTTEAQKIPLTIQNRLQRFDFLRMDIQTIENRLFEILQKEGFEKRITKEAVNYIAKISHGGMRDAITNLDKVLSIQNDKIINIEDVLNILQLSDYEILLNILLNIKTDTSAVLKILNEAFINGKDLRFLINQMIEFILDLIKGYLLDLKDTEIPNSLYDTIQKNIYNKQEHIDWLKGLLKRLFELKNNIQYESYNKPFIEGFFIAEGFTC